MKRSTVYDVLKTGYDAFAAGDLATCATSITTILKQLPNEPNALLLAAMLGMDRGKATLKGQPVDGQAHAQEWLERAMQETESRGVPWPMAWNFKSTMLFRLGKFQDAIDAADQAIAMKPDIFEARINKGNALNALGRYDEALAMYAEAGRLKPDAPSVRFNRAFPTLCLGDWKKGFELYEYRWAMPEWKRDHRREFHDTLPQWQGPRYQPIHGKRLLVHWEQGFGDTLMCLRYLPWLLDQQPSLLVFEVQRALTTLLRNRLPTEIMVLGHGDPIPLVDMWVSTLSLPHYHGTTQDNMPPPLRLSA